MTEKFVMSDNSKNGKKVVNKYSGQCGIRWNRMSEGKKKSTDPDLSLSLTLIGPRQMIRSEFI